MKKISLRLRLTLIVSLIMVLLCVLLSLASFFNARDSFSSFSSSQAIVSPDTIKAELVTLAFPSDFDFDKTKTVTFEKVQAAYTTKIIETYDIGFINFKWTTVVIMIVAIVLCTFAVWIFSGLALKPLKNFSNDIENIDEKELDYRLSDERSKDEIAKLSNSFNNMMTKLQNAFLREKRYTDAVAHELSTPLTVLKTNLQVFEWEETPTAAEFGETFELVKKETERMIELVTKMKKLSRNEALEKEETNLEPLLQSVVDEYEKKAKDEGMELNFSSTPVYASVNALSIKQCASNLVENAIKYAKSGKRISISLNEDEESAYITVSDEGDGIPEEDRERIFEPFYRVDKSRSRDIAGVGLGLSITSEIIKEHGGNIRLEKSEKGGCEFIIQLDKD